MTKIIAHRGASGYCPENTLAAFQKAIDLKADGIECDVHLSKDNIPVVCHDARVDRTSNGQGYIKDLSYKELRQLDFGSWFGAEFKGETIVALPELLDFLAPHPLYLNIEIKAGSAFYANIEEVVLNCLAQSSFTGSVILSSFDHYCLQKLKQLDPAVKTGALYTANWIKPWHYAKQFGFNALHPAYLTVTPELIQQAHLHNQEVNTYTVNVEQIAAKLAVSKIDGLITNYPDKIRAALQF